MKNLPIETGRLMQAALDARDALRRLAASIDAAGDDPGRQAEMLPHGACGGDCVQRVLRQALNDSAARRHSPADSRRWLQDKNPAACDPRTTREASEAQLPMACTPTTLGVTGDRCET